MIAGAMLFSGCAMSPQHTTLPTHSSTPTPTPSPAQGQSHDGVRLVQCMLNSIGYRAGPETGTVTPESMAAWVEWLRSHGLSPTQSDSDYTTQLLIRDYANRVAPINQRCIPKDDSPTVTARQEPTNHHVTGTGYRNIRWGETMESVQRRTGGRYSRDRDGDDTVKFNETIAGVRFNVAAYFYRNQFYMIILTGQVSPKSNVPQKIAEAMRHDFGAPTDTKQSEYQVKISWLRPNESLAMLIYDAEGMAAGRTEYPFLQMVWVAPEQYTPPAPTAQSPQPPWKSQPPQPNVATRTKRPYSI
jgi:hypothetical protein